MKFFDYSGEQKIERAQPKDGKDIRCVDDETISRDAKNGWNRIDRENQVSNFDHDQHQQQQRPDALAIDFSKEFSALIMPHDGNESRHPADNSPVFRV